MVYCVVLLQMQFIVSLKMNALNINMIRMECSDKDAFIFCIKWLRSKGRTVMLKHLYHFMVLKVTPMKLDGKFQKSNCHPTIDSDPE